MKRRLITILAVVGLGVSALVGSAPAMADEPPPGAAYVALGDSEAAGTGNLPYVDAACMRSARAYPALLADGFGGVDSEACAGADTADALLQAWSADLGPGTQLVTVTVGVNNLDWQELLVACSSAGDPAACALAYQQATADIATIPAGVAGVLAVVRTRAPNAQIVVTGYPLLFGLSLRPCRVGAFERTPVTFTVEQQIAVNDGLSAVNLAIASGVAGYAQQAQDSGVGFIDVGSTFLSHRLCDTDDRWISGLVSGGPVDDRSFHLNAAGQQAYASIIAGALAP